MDFRQEGPRVKTLAQLAQAACIRRVESLEDVGDLPYRMVRPILQKLQNPKILRTIEENCPQIAEEDAELWKAFIRRDFGNEALNKYVPKRASMWHKVYRKHKSEAASRDAQDKALLKEQMDALNNAKASRRTTIIHDLKRSEATAVKRQGISQMNRLPFGRDVFPASSSSSSSSSSKGGDALRGVRGNNGTGVFKSSKLSRILLKK